MTSFLEEIIFSTMIQYLNGPQPRRVKEKSTTTQASLVAIVPPFSQGGTLGVTLAITQGSAQPSDAGDQPPKKRIPLAKTCQYVSLLMIGPPSKANKKKFEEPKYGVITQALSPYYNLVTFISVALLLSSSSQA